MNPLLGPQSLSAPYQSTTDSIDTTPINGGAGLGPNLIDPNDTVYGIVTDNNAIMVAAKYKWDPFKFFAGYEYIWQNNPENPLGVGASDQGGYFMSGVEDNNLDSEKLVNIWWTGAKYTYRKKTDITFAWYQQRQNDFRVPPTCSATAGFRGSCAGTLNEGSFYPDHHFTKRFDAYAGLAYSWVTGGLAIAIPHGPGSPLLPRTITALRQSVAVSASERSGPSPPNLVILKRSAVSEARQRGVEDPYSLLHVTPSPGNSLTNSIFAESSFRGRAPHSCAFCAQDPALSEVEGVGTTNLYSKTQSRRWQQRRGTVLFPLVPHE